MSKIGILGAGTWGTAIGILLSDNGHDVTMWSKIEKEAKDLDESRDNIKNLPGAILPKEVKITLDIKEACNDKDIIVMAVASPYTRVISKEAAPYIKEGQIVINVSKGLENGTLLTLADVIKDEIPQADAAVLVAATV